MNENLANDLTLILLQQSKISNPDEIVGQYYETLGQVEAALKNRTSPEIPKAKPVQNFIRI